MGYCTIQQMEARFGRDELIQLTDRSGTGELDTQVLNEAIEDASNEIDGYLGGRYTLPLAVVPTVLVRLACNIARLNLYEVEPPPNVRQRYEDAVRFLQAVSAGRVSLGIDAEGAKAPPSGGAEMVSGGRVFSRDDNGFV